jgi:sugar phosphate isomerase/epimerase
MGPSEMAVAGPMVLWSGCLPALTFRQLVETAADGGFDAITVAPPTWSKAQRREGLTLLEMRRILDRRGIAVAAVDGCSDWLPDVGGPVAVGVRPGTPRSEFFAVAEALGADTVIAVHLRAPADDLDTAPAGRAFARLCDDANRIGLRVGLEFVPFTAIRDVALAWEIVQRSGRENAGLILDFVHHARGGADDRRLLEIPPDRIFAVQLCDAPAAAPPDLVEETMFHRLDPGTGDLGIVGLLRQLHDRGVRAPAGPEVYRRSWTASHPRVTAERLARSSRDVLTAAGWG